MKSEKLIDALGNIDDTYIEEAHAEKRFSLKAFSWRRMVPVLAGALCIFLFVIAVPSLTGFGGMGGAAPKEQSADYAKNEAEYYVPSGADYSYADGSQKEEYADTYAREAEKKILTAYLRMETQDFDPLMDTISTLLADKGGYVQHSNSYTRGDDSRVYEATLRIPSKNYSSFLEELKGQGNAVSYEENVEDITTAYQDLQARLDSYKAQEEKVLEFYEKAESLEELITVESRLSEIRYEIERIETQIKNYDLLVNYSTLNLTITETKVYTPVNPNFFTRLANAFTGGWRNFTRGIGNFMIDIVYHIWDILLIVIVLAAAFFGYRRFRKGRK